MKKFSSKKGPFFKTVKDECEIFRNSHQEAYVTVSFREKIQTLHVKSRTFALVLTSLFFNKYHTPPSGSFIKDIVNMVEAEAACNSPERNTSIRVAENNGDIFVYLANQEQEQVKITKNGWKIKSADQSPILFVKSPLTAPMARPEKNGSLATLWEFVNLESEHDKVMLIAWLLSTFLPDGPFPILNIQGEQGSGKSFLTRIILELTDPSRTAIRSLPKSEQDLFISFLKCRVIACDNISHIKDWLSDAFCRLSTGGGFATRALYTDVDEIVIDIKRSLIVNGISEVFFRNDLIERTIVINTTTISQDNRMPESVLRARWEEVKPGILGALFDAVSMALTNRDTIKMEESPRMADFAHWIVAAEPALPWPSGTFLQAYSSNRMKAINNAIEADPVASAVLHLTEQYVNWSGTPTDLLTLLNTFTSDEIRRLKSWPKMPNSLSAKLRRCATFLRERNIEIEFSKSGVRNISIYSTPPQPTAPALPGSN